jgi:plastocyanin
MLGLVVAVPAAATLTIIQRGLALDRESASVARGDRIVFTNDDDVIHNIHILGPGSEDNVDLGLQSPGKKLGYKFDVAGSYRVRCNIHPSVKMSVTVR